MSPLVVALAGVIIVWTLVGVAIGRYPVLRMNRATIALTGATLLTLIGAIPLDRAYAALDLNTLVLLFAMMVINVNLRLAGFFRLISGWVVRGAHSPRQLLVLVIVFSGALSALFLNDTILAGNLTLLGSVANLIVAETARARGVTLSFREYLRAGAPITVLTLVIGALWLSVLP